MKRMAAIPALEEVQFSIAATARLLWRMQLLRAYFPSGRIVSARSRESIVEEGKLLTRLPGFKGYIHDVAADSQFPPPCL